MASVTKNPMILQSAVYVYNWFVSKTSDEKTNKLLNMVEVAESDLYIAEKIKADYENKVDYEDLEGRMRRLADVYNPE